MAEQYKDTVEQIVHLNWQSLEEENLQRLMYLSYAAAREFAEALRIALLVYPADPKLREMAKGELETENMQHENYAEWGDHADFLRYFLEQAGFAADAELEQAFQTYLRACRNLDAETRAMTIFSREHELGAIFEEILKNEHWNGAALGAFRYYLKRHIELDTTDGGHADLVDTYPVDDSVLPFYQARLDLYRVIPELFQR